MLNILLMNWNVASVFYPWPHVWPVETEMHIAQANGLGHKASDHYFDLCDYNQIPAAE